MEGSIEQVTAPALSGAATPASAAVGPGRRQRAEGALRRAMPFGSLALGLVSAVWMDRSPERAGLIALASVLGWALLVALWGLARVEEAGLPAARRRWLQAARFGSLAASSWLIQLTLFFVTPFFAKASAGLAGHYAFLALLAAAGAITLWDPLFQALLKHPLGGPVLQAGASFAGLAAVLPILGISNRVGLWGAALATAAALPLSQLASGARRRAVLGALGVGLLAPAGLLAGGAALVPAAPLRLLSVEMGEGLAGYEVAAPAAELASPAQLVCATSLWAPRGLRDELVHVWKHDGREVDRVALKVVGGRSLGFRTFSRKSRLSPGEGTWTCSVQTRAGQLLGEREVRLVAGPAGPAAPP